MGVWHLQLPHRERGLKNQHVGMLPSKEEVCLSELFDSRFKRFGETGSQQLRQEVSDTLLQKRLVGHLRPCAHQPISFPPPSSLLSPPLFSLPTPPALPMACLSFQVSHGRTSLGTALAWEKGATMKNRDPHGALSSKTCLKQINERLSWEDEGC